MRVVVHLVTDGTIEMEDSLAPLLDNYAERLKQRRKARGLTVSQLSRMTEVTPSAIARIERGERIPGIDTVAKLEKALE